MDFPTTFDGTTDASGNFSKRFTRELESGTYLLKVIHNFLMIENEYIVDVYTPLQFVETPSSINFGVINLEEHARAYERQSSDKIVVQDRRKIKTGWKLSVYVEPPLHVTRIENSSILGAFILKEYPNQAIYDNPVLVYETTGTNYDKETVIEWQKDEGLQLFIKNFGEIYTDEDYSAKLVWVLEEK